MRVAVTLEQCWHRVPGGIARAAIEQVQAVADRGDVQQIGVSAWHRQPPAEAWVPPIEVQALPLPRLALYEAWHYLGWPGVERASGPIDVIHATGTVVPPRTAPLVVTVHDLAVLHDPDQFTRRGVSFIRRAIKLTAERADLVLCSSRATLDDCLIQGFDPDRLRLVPLGVDQTRATETEIASVRAAHGLNDRYVLFVGTLEPRKNLVGLLAAFEQVMAQPGMGDVRLVVVGPSGWGEDLSPQLARLGDRVQQVGFVSGSDLRAIYAGAEVFCYPSFLEGFGLPVLEAMVQGTPVVTSAGTATEELVAAEAGPGAGGPAGVAVSPRDTQSIGDAITELLEDPTAAVALGQAGQKRAAQYRWADTAELVVNAYREVVN